MHVHRWAAVVWERTSCGVASPNTHGCTSLVALVVSFRTKAQRKRRHADASACAGAEDGESVRVGQKAYLLANSGAFVEVYSIYCIV